MKVVQREGRLVHIAKTVPKEEALGASIDVYKFSPPAARAFFDRCEAYIRSGQRDLWSEVALDDILQEVIFRACPLTGRWLEIDDEKDLRAADALFREEGGAWNTDTHF